MNEHKSAQAQSTLEIREISHMIWKRKWVILLPLVLVTGGAIGASYTLTPKYESSVIVQVYAQIKYLGELQGLVGSPRETRATRATRRDQLSSIYNEITSTKYVRLLNDRLSLGDNPELQKRARTNTQLQPSLSFEQAVIDVLQEEFKASVQVAWVAGDQVTITVKSTNPVTARDIADNLGEIYVDEKLKQELIQIRSSQNFSDIQLQKYENQLAERIREKTDLKKELLAVQLDEAILSESNRDEITSEVDRGQQQITDYRRDEKSLVKRLLADKSLTDEQLVLAKSENLSSLESDLKERLGQIGDLIVKYPWSDTRVTNFKVRLNDIQTAIEREIRRLVDKQFSTNDDSTRLLLSRLFNVRSNLDYQYIKQPYLKSAVDELKTKTELMPEYNARLNELNHEIAAITDLRDRFRRQQQISAISQDLARDVSSSRYRVVEPAKLALGPVYPDRRKITVMGILLGLIIGGAAVVLAELLDNSFKNVHDTEEYLGIPVLGVVPGIDVLKKA